MSVHVNRIEKEFILRKIIEKKTVIRILYKKKEIEGRLIKFNDTVLTLQGMEDDVPLFMPGDEIQVFFIFENNQHTFTSLVKKIDGNSIIIEQPVKTYKNLQRQYERITSTGDIQVFFNIKGKRIRLDFPRAAHFYPLEEPGVKDNFDMSDMHHLISSFREKMNDIVSVNKIIMLRNSQSFTYEEKLMAKTGKILWFPVIKEGFIIKNEYPGYALLTYKDVHEYEIEAGTPGSEIGQKLEKLLKDKTNRGFYSQLYCPLLYNEYLIGYIYLCNYTARKIPISIETIRYVYEFSKVLCYSLKENHYFKEGKADDTTYAMPIIDISGSGLLFTHREKKLSLNLLLHSKIDITLKIGKRTMEITSEIMRKYNDKNRFYTGLRFTSITKEDFRFLYEFIYGKKYSIQGEIMWKDI